MFVADVKCSQAALGLWAAGTEESDRVSLPAYRMCSSMIG